MPLVRSNLLGFLLIGLLTLTACSRPGESDYGKGMDAYAEKRYNDSIPHLTKAADAGHLNSMAQLGAMFLKGEGVARDAKQSARWFKLCADKGHAQCQSLLGLLYLNGVGVPKNAVSARLWLQKAADQGDERSAWVLENLVERGTLAL